MDIVNPQVEDYMRSLQARHDEPVLLEMERLGYVRQLAVPQSGRSGRWILICDPAQTGLAGLFHRLAVDPRNSLLPNHSGLGLDAWLRPGLFGAWLQTPLAQLSGQREP